MKSVVFFMSYFVESVKCTEIASCDNDIELKRPTTSTDRRKYSATLSPRDFEI